MTKKTIWICILICSLLILGYFALFRANTPKRVVEYVDRVKYVDKVVTKKEVKYVDKVVTIFKKNGDKVVIVDKSKVKEVVGSKEKIQEKLSKSVMTTFNNNTSIFFETKVTSKLPFPPPSKEFLENSHIMLEKRVWSSPILLSVGPRLDFKELQIGVRLEL